MKPHTKIWRWFAILSFVVLGCNTKENDKATITIKSTTQLNADVKVSLYKNLDDTTLIESKTDSTGLSSFEVTLQKPIFVVFQIGKKYGEVYLSPGYNLVIKENGQEYQIPLAFSGKGAEINNYISRVNSTVEKMKWANGRGLIQLNTNEFLHRFDSLKTTINDFHERYIDSVTLPNVVASMLEYKNRIKLLEVGQEYKFYRLNNSINEKWEAYKNGQNYVEGKVSKELEKLTDEMPFDTTLLTDGYGDYQRLLNFYWHNKINLPIADELVGPKDSGNVAPLKTNALIKKARYPDKIREFFIAFNLRYWLAAMGITPETDSVFASFKRTYQKSNYLPVLNRSYNGWLAIAPGKPAPEFEGYSHEGKKISIKDLKGKIVYIDVWATWCGPCVAEIPASKKLQKELTNEDKVQFLNVSLDSKRSDWEKFLKKNKAWKGLHIIIEPEMIQSFYTTYKLFGVPGYILIDQSGNIVTMKASRPSEGKIKSQIKQLLARSQESNK
jgi:thiol-disulfide isomerase/thioredoxin